MWLVASTDSSLLCDAELGLYPYGAGVVDLGGSAPPFVPPKRGAFYVGIGRITYQASPDITRHHLEQLKWDSSVPFTKEYGDSGQFQAI